MDDTVIWIIIIGFYAPLHYLPPLLMVLFKTTDENRSNMLWTTAMDCTISMALAFGLVALVGLENMLLAMSILLLAIFLPYLRVIKVMISNRRGVAD
ncbi:MAG: hypothetical protein P8Y20_06790 [Gammaproteobacteria bacterium]|jgi:hypothetical protein